MLGGGPGCGGVVGGPGCGGGDVIEEVFRRPNTLGGMGGMGSRTNDARSRGGNIFGGNPTDARSRGGNIFGGNPTDARSRGGNIFGGNPTDARSRGGNTFGGNPTNTRSQQQRPSGRSAGERQQSLGTRGLRNRN